MLIKPYNYLNAFKTVSVMTREELWLSFSLIVYLHANATGRLILAFFFVSCGHTACHSYLTDPGIGTERELR